MKSYSLCIDSLSGRIDIPFKGLLEIDKFTSYYDNIYDLKAFFMELLKINPSEEENVKIEIKEINVGKKGSYVRNMPVVYKKDIFSKESLHASFVIYLLKDLERIKKCGITNLPSYSIEKYLREGEGISLKELEFITLNYLSLGYLEQREIYFLLQEDKPQDDIHDFKIAKYKGKNIENSKFLQNLKTMYETHPEMQEQLLEEIMTYDDGAAIMQKILSSRRQIDEEISRLIKYSEVKAESIFGNLKVTSKRKR